MEYGLVVLWLVAYLALMAVGMPLATALFPRLADRGAGLALPASLALLWVVVYLVGQVSLTAALWVGIAVLIVATIGLSYRGVEFEHGRYAEAAAVFAVAFLLMVAIRAVDANVHPLMGEKFLDFGLLKSILRAEALPPEDMWFAGRPVEYYYGGHLLAAMLTRLTGTDPRYGYNLALAGFYAMLVTSAYGLAGSIAASRGVSRTRAGAFGAFFAGFASNVSTPGRFLAWLLPDGLSSTAAGLISVDLERLAAGGPDAFHYWSASRIIDGTINEFPLFAWLNGDMHAHMMSTPFVLLAAGLLFSYYRTPEAERTRRRLLLLGAVPPLAGLLGVVNTWSFPTVGGLVFLSVALAPAEPASLLPNGIADRLRRDVDWQRETSRYGVALCAAAVVVVLGILWTLPFWLGTASGRSIGFFPDRSPMGQLLGVHGAFALVFGLYLFRHALPAVERERASEVGVMLALGTLLAWVGSGAAAVALFGPMMVVGWILLRTQAGALRRAGAEVAGTARRAVRDGGSTTASSARGASGDDGDARIDRLRDVVGYETVLFVAGAGIVVIVEFAYVQEQAGPGRMNTVFKTYADVWVLWAVAAGAMLAHLVENHSPSLALSSGRWKTGLRALAAVIVVSTAMYGAFALTDHFSAEDSPKPYAHPDEPTLDGLKFVSEEHPGEAPAIAWLDDLEGQPNVASAPGRDMYQWTNPESSLTGVPTLAGWQHEVGYRGSDVYHTRASDADAIFSGPVDQRAYLLDTYEVEYIYVGSNEDERYDAEDLETLESMDAITVAQEWDEVVVYRVDQDRLSY